MWDFGTTAPLPLKPQVLLCYTPPRTSVLTLHTLGGVDLATLRKGDLAGKVASKLGGPRSQGDAALNAVLDSVREALASGDRVVLTGFGAFESRQVKERQVRAIRGRQAGQRVTVPAHKRVGFTAGSELAAAVRGRR